MASPIARMLARMLAWVRRTPLGSPVLPDVYWMSAGSPAASRSGGRSGAGAGGRATLRAPGGGGGRGEPVSRRDRGEGGDARPEQRRDAPGLGERHEQARPGVPEDLDLAPRVLLDPVGAERRGGSDRGRARAGG